MVSVVLMADFKGIMMIQQLVQLMHCRVSGLIPSSSSPKPYTCFQFLSEWALDRTFCLAVVEVGAMIIVIYIQQLRFVQLRVNIIYIWLL